jgi:hypothetical protein
MAVGFLGIQDKPFMGILTIMLPEEITLLAEHFDYSETGFSKKYATAWF